MKSWKVNVTAPTTPCLHCISWASPCSPNPPSNSSVEIWSLLLHRSMISPFLPILTSQISFSFFFSFSVIVLVFILCPFDYYTFSFLSVWFFYYSEIQLMQMITCLSDFQFLCWYIFFCLEDNKAVKFDSYAIKHQWEILSKCFGLFDCVRLTFFFCVCGNKGFDRVRWDLVGGTLRRGQL